MVACYCNSSLDETEIPGSLGLVPSHSRLCSEFQNSGIYCLRQSKKVRQYLKNDFSVFFSTSIFTCIHVSGHTHEYTHIHTHIPIDQHIHLHTCEQTCTLMCVHTHVCTWMYMYTPEKLCDTPGVLKIFTRHLKDTSYYTCFSVQAKGVLILLHRNPAYFLIHLQPESIERIMDWPGRKHRYLK